MVTLVDETVKHLVELLRVQENIQSE